MNPQHRTPDEVRRAYHSGFKSGKMIKPENLLTPALRGLVDRQITLDTAKYPPPAVVTLRTDVGGWGTDINGTFANGRWSFVLPGNAFRASFQMKFVLDGTFWMLGDNVQIDDNQRDCALNDAGVSFAYQLRFKTNRWRPNCVITLRNSVDGWGRDLYGVFRDGAWSFELDRAYYPSSLEAKLVCGQSVFMNGANLVLTAAGPNLDLDDQQVTFSAEPDAYVHGYDNFLPIATPLEPLTLRSVGREDEHFDVVIVGSGTGGGTLANDLSNRGARVLVLEAGGVRYPVHFNELPRSEVDIEGRDQLGHYVNQCCQGNYWFLMGAHFNLGGRSIYWSGVIPRMQDWELREVWPAEVRDYLTLAPPAGDSGYDLAEKLMRKQKTLGPFQDKASSFLQSQLGQSFIVSELPRSMHQPDIDGYGHLQNVIERSTGCFSTADLLLDSLGFTDKAGRDNLRVNLQHLATRIETSGKTATAVVCQDLAGNTERRYRGNVIVLACGSLESPKLAINSNLTDPSAKMGRGLTDHPAYFYKIYHELPTVGNLGWLGDPKGHAKIMIQRSPADKDHHAYHIELLINSKYWDTRHSDDQLWTDLIDNGQPSRVEIKFIFDSLLVEENHITCHGAGEKIDVCVVPNPSADHYKAEMVEVRNQILGALGITGLSTTWNCWEWSEGIYGTVNHAGGTLRMSDNGSGVVDQDLKFLGYDNLYCCDVSVFPSIPAANPSLTLAALALRLSKTIIGRLPTK